MALIHLKKFRHGLMLTAAFLLWPAGGASSMTLQTFGAEAETAVIEYSNLSDLLRAGNFTLKETKNSQAESPGVVRK